MWDYGYGELEDQIIDLFRHYPPDFTKAENLVLRGVNLNAFSEKEPDENMLSEILCGYWGCESSSPEDSVQENADCDTYGHPEIADAPSGKTMVRIVQFFLTHGFSVSTHDDRYGAQCLVALVLSTFDHYMLEAACLLLDAGAKNTIAYEDVKAIDEVGTKCSFYQSIEPDYHLGNLYEAFYQMLLAVDESRPYHGIDCYMACSGKRIKRVLATKPMDGSVFYDLVLPFSVYKNCFNQTLFFEYDCGYLILSQYAEVWTDTVLPEGEFADVTDCFCNILNSCISQITFEQSEIRKGFIRHGQPIVNMTMENDVTVHFSINFGEVEEANGAAFYYFSER